MTQEERNRIFEKIDKASLDAEGKQIVFGDAYRHADGNLHRVAGLDLRSSDFLFTFNISQERYDCVQARKLTHEEEDR